MAKIKGFEMKNVKNIIGREGYGVSGTIYINGKKIATYIDYGDGAPEEVNYISEAAREQMMKLVIEYAKSHLNNFIVNLYKERPKQYKEECERFKKINPFIPESDITIETMASNSEAYIVSDFMNLLDVEKFFKKQQKKGYKAIGIKNDELIAYPCNWSIEKIEESAKENKIEKLYKSLDDFDIK
jgi:hypothetical protein